jgi:hypothetical protein
MVVLQLGLKISRATFHRHERRPAQRVAELAACRPRGVRPSQATYRNEGMWGQRYRVGAPRGLFGRNGLMAAITGFKVRFGSFNHAFLAGRNVEIVGPRWAR